MSETKLLIVKQQENYIRFTEDGFDFVQMNKASVYPLESENGVRQLCTRLEGFEGICLMKLTIIEEPFSEVSI